jgi:hypothetical protein
MENQDAVVACGSTIFDVGVIVHHEDMMGAGIVLQGSPGKLRRLADVVL